MLAIANKNRGNQKMTLRELETGKSAIVTAVGGEGALRQHFLDMGLIPGTEITLVKYAPMGDPMELRLHSYELTLRLSDAERIIVEPHEIEDGQKEQGQLKKHIAQRILPDGVEVIDPEGKIKKIPADSAGIM